jgi:hypothetical protein
MIDLHQPIENPLVSDDRLASDASELVSPVDFGESHQLVLIGRLQQTALVDLSKPACTHVVHLLYI